MATIPEGDHDGLPPPQGHGHNVPGSILLRVVSTIHTDQRMPGGSGSELLGEVRRMRPKAVRVVPSLTGPLPATSSC